MDVIKNWSMVFLAGVFILLYTVALLGWLKPLSDVAMVTRLEPLIFIIIGYYFGRRPAQQNEQSLRDAIDRETKKAEEIQHLLEQAQQEREALDEKLENVKIILTSLTGKVSTANMKNPSSDEAANLKTQRHSIINAINILNS
jgi:hypothetical protein